MPKIDVEAYEKRLDEINAAREEVDEPLTDLVWSISQREGERQSYAYISSVLNGDKRSRPVLDKMEEELAERGVM